MADPLHHISAAIALPPVIGNALKPAADVASGPTAHDAQDACPPPLTATGSSDLAGLDKSVTPEPQPGSKKAIVRKSLDDLGRFLKTPLGILVGLYGILVVAWGAALVVILAGWTPMTKNTQDIWVEICSQVLNGLFTITGIGLIPWRIHDAWHMSVITRYRRKILKLARQRRRRRRRRVTDGELTESADASSFLAEAERTRLARSEQKFMHAQPWYIPRETDTHRVFPFGLALTITCLVVANSVFQCFLCGVMWGLNRHTRPAWTTALLIVMSFGCGIGAAILIWWGGKKSLKRKQDEIV